MRKTILLNLVSCINSLRGVQIKGVNYKTITYKVSTFWRDLKTNDVISYSNVLFRVCDNSDLRLDKDNKFAEVPILNQNLNVYDLSKKKILLAFTLLFLINLNLKAQITVSTTGGDSTDGLGRFSYSIGQVFYQSIFSTNESLIQGVQQPFEIQSLLGLSDNELNLNIRLYPNPTSDYIILDIINRSDLGSTLDYQIYDLQSKLIKSGDIENNEIVIRIEELVSAIYILKINTKNELLKTFKIIKN